MTKIATHNCSECGAKLVEGQIISVTERKTKKRLTLCIRCAEHLVAFE